jgi:type II secretory pathway component PulJ
MTPPLPSSFPRGEQGFTLIEMLVTLVTGIVIVLAAFSILDVSLTQSSRISERVETDQRARLAMEKILLELHSSCVVSVSNAIEQNSNATDIQFISQPGSEVYFTTVTKHEISLSGGKLTDASYVSEPSSSGDWKFHSTPTSTETLLTNVSQSKVGETTVPIFQYYRYTGGNLSTTPESVPLSLESAEDTAEVTVSFTTTATTGEEKTGQPVALADTAVLRFDPASAAGNNEPCS